MSTGVQVPDANGVPQPLPAMTSAEYSTVRRNIWLAVAGHDPSTDRGASMSWFDMDLWPGRAGTYEMVVQSLGAMRG